QLTLHCQLVLKLSSTFVDPVKVERMERGYLRWDQEGHPELEYEKIIACTNKAVCISKAKKVHIADSCLNSGIHTFDFHFSFPLEVPSTSPAKFAASPISCRGFAAAMPPFVVEARNDVNYLCCFTHSSVILQISLEKNVFFPSENIVFTADIANRTCNYIIRQKWRSIYLGRSNEVTRFGVPARHSPFDTMRVTSALVLPKSLPVTSALSGNNIMAFKYELVGTSDLPCAMSTIFGRVPIIIPAIPEHLWSREP
ncbi:LOW QUALITY PROTEIN: arrestin domain-containing protein 5, partial [Coturnix japonica]|uniref:LOW QUALITY PROTEIN: arrestin domain-containing protein 5 n=1 Tax=Coturnix japonica TaxID=93934 RepID=UPI0013A5EF3C